MTALDPVDGHSPPAATSELDTSAVSAWLDRVYAQAPGLVAISHQDRGGRFRGSSGVHSGPDTLLAQVRNLDAAGARGIYLRTTTLASRPQSGARGSAADSHALPGLWADVDFGTDGHKPGPGLPLPPDTATAWSIVTSSGLPEPSLWVHSGGGLYPWWLLEQPLLIDDANRQSVTDLSAQWQQALGRSAELLGYSYGTGVGDLSRVLRLPGTLNRKTDTPRPCQVVEDTGQAYTFPELLQAVMDLPAAERTPQTAPPRQQARRDVVPLTQGASAFDQLDAAATFDDILTGAGWTPCQQRTHPPAVDQCWTRPGDPDNPCSAHTLTARPEVLVVHSELAGLPTGGGQKLTRGRLFAHLHHHGDERTAALDIFAAIGGRPATPAAQALPLPRETRPVTTTSPPPITRADLVDLEPPPPEDEPAPPLEIEVDLSTLLDVVTASDVTLRRVRYLWDRRIPLGAMTLMPGEEGIGKTTVGVRLIAELTCGTLPGEHHGTPRDVIVLATEDGLEDVFVPRLQEAGADLSRVHIIRASIGLDGDKRQVIVPRDLAYIRLLVRKHDAAMVYIDSLVTTLPDELKSISYKDTAKVLKALGGWAEAERVSVVAPWHLNKTSGSDTALRIMDSRAFRTAVRSMLLIVPDPDAPEGVTQGIVALDKANAGTLNVPALRYRIRSATYTVPEVDEQTGEVTDVTASCGVADWIGEVDGDGRQIAREALTPAIERDGSPKTWLREHLLSEGEASRVDVIAAAREAGFSLDQIKRAARSLGVHSRDVTGRDEKTGRPWRAAVWSLPQSGHTHPTAPTAPTGETTTAPTTPIGAGQTKSVQSVQSVGCRETAPTGAESAPTGETTVKCPCGRHLAPGRALDGHTLCKYCIEDKESA